MRTKDNSSLRTLEKTATSLKLNAGDDQLLERLTQRYVVSESHVFGRAVVALYLHPRSLVEGDESTEDTRVVSVRLTPAQVAIVDELMVELGLDTRAAVLRRALRVVALGGPALGQVFDAPHPYSILFFQQGGWTKVDYDRFGEVISERPWSLPP